MDSPTRTGHNHALTTRQMLAAARSYEAQVLDENPRSPEWSSRTRGRSDRLEQAGLGHHKRIDARQADGLRGEGSHSCAKGRHRSRCCHSPCAGAKSQCTRTSEAILAAKRVPRGTARAQSCRREPHLRSPSGPKRAADSLHVVFRIGLHRALHCRRLLRKPQRILHHRSVL
jgi:hypothetical protein